MHDYSQFLLLAKDVARSALRALKAVDKSSTSYNFSENLPKEMKSSVDKLLEKIILDSLRPTGLPILSEEVGEIAGFDNNGLRWIVDPLDGTVNYMRGLASCAVSIALWCGDVPVFGVIGEYPSCSLAWGGQLFGAYIEDIPIHVSAIIEKSQAIICTGFPSRFEFCDVSASIFLSKVFLYSKVRMLGAASLSLLQVARGAADVYFEDQIMLWDVAAGLAIIQGAGGNFKINLVSATNPCCVMATNNVLMDAF